MNTLGFLLATIVSVAADVPVQPVGDPLAKLPANVKAEKGKLTLFADFSDKKLAGIPVYIINRTGKPVTLQHSINDFLVVLEYESAPNTWPRAEPRRMISGCGLMPMQFELADESFVERTSYFPQEGKKAKVRYAMYRQPFEVASNVGDGFIVEEEVRKAKSDALAVLTGNFEFVSKVARGELKLTSEMKDLLSHDLRGLGIFELSNPRFPRADAEKVLKSIAMSGEDLYATMATNVLGRLESQKQR
jgi:hypothetical protein